MATVVQPPFWVPRQSADDSWQPTLPPSVTLHALSAQKFYSGNGQPPTQRWDVLKTQDDSAYWQGRPLPTYQLYVGINEKMLRAPGQVTQRNWAVQIGQQDDSVQWVGQPFHSANIQILAGLFLNNMALATENFRQIGSQDESNWLPYYHSSWNLRTQVIQTMFGVQGQVLQPRFSQHYNADDSAPWQIEPNFLTSLTIPFLTKSKLFGQGGQVVQYRPNLHVDEAPSWNWAETVIGINALPNLFPPPVRPQGAIKPSFFVPRPGDDERQFQAIPLASLTLAFLTMHPVHAPIYVLGGSYDSPSAAQSVPISPALKNIQGPRPLSLYKWDSQDDPSYPTPRRDLALVQFILSSQPVLNTRSPFQPIEVNEDGSLWAGQPLGVGSLYSKTQQIMYGLPGQSPPYRHDITNDDAAPWTPEINSLSRPTVFTILQPNANMPSVILWAPDDEDQPALWSGSGVQSNQNVLRITPSPPGFPAGQYPRSVWRHDDPSGWDGKPLANPVLRGLTNQTIYGRPGQVPPFRPNFTLDDASTWQPVTYRNNIFFATKIGYPPNDTVGFSTLRSPWAPFQYDTAESQWSVGLFNLSPNYALTRPDLLPPTKHSPQYQLWVATNDIAESQWYARPIASYQTLVPSAYPHGAPIYVLTGGNSAPEWVGRPTPNNSILNAPQGPRPLDLYPWRLNDDPADWQWQPRYPVMQQKLTAAPRPAPIYVLTGGNDSPPWQQPALFNVNLAITTIIGNIFWAPDDVDENAVWKAGSVGLNLAINPPSNQSLMVPSIKWSPDDEDQPALWSGSGVQSNQQLFAIPPTPPGKPSNQYPRGVWRIDDWVDPAFCPSINNLLLRYLPTPRPGLGIGEAVPPPWQALTTQDDPAYWVGTPLPSSIINSVPQFFGQKGQVPPFRPNFTLDDPPLFQGAPSAAWPLSLLAQTKLFGQGGQVIPFRPNFTIDDPPMWQGMPSTNVLSMLYTKTVYPPGGSNTALVMLRWSAAPFNYDVGEAPGWVGEPFSPDYMLSGPAKPVPKLFDWLDFFRRGRRRQ